MHAAVETAGELPLLPAPLLLALLVVEAGGGTAQLGHEGRGGRGARRGVGGFSYSDAFGAWGVVPDRRRGNGGGVGAARGSLLRLLHLGPPPRPPLLPPSGPPEVVLVVVGPVLALETTAAPGIGFEGEAGEQNEHEEDG